jgi:8-oxo-dGTP diphosphatase
MQQLENFNVRVYGILIHKNRLLVVDEHIKGRDITKFPGGGLELGEGTRQCVEREFMEEAGTRVEAGEHFYTTDFFQQSIFREKDQLISIYYYVSSKELKLLKTSTKKFDYAEGAEHSFRWLPMKKLDAAEFTFPIDKHVAHLLLRQYRDLPTAP